MPRYFFHLRDGRSLPDRHGTVLPDIAAVRREATRFAGETLRDRARILGAQEAWSVEAEDGRGQVLFTLRFTAAEAPAPG